MRPITDELLESISTSIHDYVNQFEESGTFDLVTEIEGKTISAEGTFTVHEKYVPGDYYEPSYTSLTYSIEVDSVIIDILNDETQYEFSRAELQRLNNEMKWYE